MLTARLDIFSAFALSAFISSCFMVSWAKAKPDIMSAIAKASIVNFFIPESPFEVCKVTKLRETKACLLKECLGAVQRGCSTDLGRCVLHAVADRNLQISRSRGCYRGRTR